MDDLLIWCYRKFGPVARRLGVQKVARRVYEELAALRYPEGSLSTVSQNGRVWRLRRDVAERGEMQEFDTISWLREVIRPGMTVLDIGANIGQMTLEMAYLVGPEGRVIAVEPSLGNLAYLRQHVAGNGLTEQVTIVPAACAEQDGGEISFFVAGSEGISSVGSGHNIVGAQAIARQSAELQVHEVRVPRISIDGLCRRLGIQPAVIKVDVEGAELLVIKGAAETLRASRPQVRVGFHPFAFDDPAAASRELMSLARTNGYQMKGVGPDDLLELAEYNWAPS